MQNGLIRPYILQHRDMYLLTSFTFISEIRSISLGSYYDTQLHVPKPRIELICITYAFSGFLIWNSKERFDKNNRVCFVKLYFV